jgi:hypothetical protein
VECWRLSDSFKVEAWNSAKLENSLRGWECKRLTRWLVESCSHFKGGVYFNSLTSAFLKRVTHSCSFGCSRPFVQHWSTRVSTRTYMCKNLPLRTVFGARTGFYRHCAFFVASTFHPLALNWVISCSSSRAQAFPTVGCPLRAIVALWDLSPSEVLFLNLN